MIEFSGAELSLMKTEISRYRGRFAPSPTGPLHFGSLVAAVGSFLDAKSRQGEWLVRIEDLDPPRVVPGAADGILRTLDAFGLYWDGEVMYQSRRGESYRDALEHLQHAGAIYPCNCSRREIAESGFNASSGLVYPGYCRNGMRPGRREHALRVKVDDKPVEFRDRLQGNRIQRLASGLGDFVLRRADGLYAYQLAVVIDDAAQGISDVVRGADILDSTPRQIYLQKLLELPTPSYLHLPVVLNVQGEKLSKQTLAPPVDVGIPLPQLFKVLEFLGQNPPGELLQGDLGSFWVWAITHWTVGNIPARLANISC